MEYGSEAAVAAAKRYGAMIGDPNRTLYWKFTIEFGLMYEEMVKQWCEKCIGELEALTGQKTNGI